MTRQQYDTIKRMVDDGGITFEHVDVRHYDPDTVGLPPYQGPWPSRGGPLRPYVSVTINSDKALPTPILSFNLDPTGKVCR